MYFTFPKQVPVPTAPANSEKAQTEKVVKPAEKVAPKVALKPARKVLKGLKNVTLKSEKSVSTFSPEKGGFTNFSLAKYKSQDKTSDYTINTVEQPFLSLNSKQNLPVEIVDFKNTENSVTTTEVISNTNIKIFRNYTLDKENPYLMNCKISFVNEGKTIANAGDFTLATSQIMPLEPNEDGFMYGPKNNLQVSWMESGDDSVESVSYADVQEGDVKQLATANAQWISVENRYFCSILSTKHAFNGISAQSTGEKETLTLGSGAIVQVGNLGPNQTLDMNFSAYLGPKKYAYLSSLGQGQEDILDLGWSFIRPISKMVLKFLVWLNGMGLSFGLAIILITIIIKTLFWPITHKSSVSMKKMSALQPKMKEINEKYKDNQQLRSQKIMELYRENKVNPVGGCLPMFIQIPVFFALYSTFRCAIELRHDSFMWCVDLAKPDTVGHIFGQAINPLAIIMVVSMLAQQILTPTAGDPNQKKMMMFMPLIMLIFMYDMPAGLTLYWTVNQFISIVQQYFTNKSVKQSKTA